MDARRSRGKAVRDGLRHPQRADPHSRSRTRWKKCCGSGTIVGLANHTILVAKDGVERPIDDSAAPIGDEAGKMVGVVLTFRDVTEQREADRALRETGARTPTRDGPRPGVSRPLRPGGPLRFVNKGYAERFGLTPPDLLGKRIRDVVGEQAYANFGQHVEAALSGQSVEFEVEIPYERIGPHVMHCAYAPEFDASGRVEGLVAVITDVTQRKRAEDALRESEQRFARFMQHLPGLAWIKDGQGPLRLRQRCRRPSLPHATGGTLRQDRRRRVPAGDGRTVQRERPAGRVERDRRAGDRGVGA